MLYSAVAETGEEVFGLLVLGIGEEGCGSALLEDDAFVHEAVSYTHLTLPTTERV